MKNFHLGVVTTHISPSRGFGGPVESVEALVKEWQRQGVQTVVCSSDGSVSTPVKAVDITYIPTNNIYLYKTYMAVRWGFGLGAILAIFKVIRKSDAMYINGFATFPTTIAAIMSVIMRRPMIIASRGGMVEGHVERVQSTRPLKWLYYKMFAFPFLQRALAIHVSSELEATGVKQVFPDIRLCVVPNGIDIDIDFVFQKDKSPVSEGINYLFVGRLSIEKGIRKFLEVWIDNARPKDKFILVGEGEGPYANSILKLIKGAKAEITYRGWLGKDGVYKEMESAHFIVLPSGIEGYFRENFGNVVAEALAIGTPPIVASETVWSNLEEQGIGCTFGSDNKSITTALQKAESISEEAYKRMVEQSKEYAKKNLAINACAAKLLSVFCGYVTPKIM